MFNWKKTLVSFALKIVKAEVLDKIEYAPALGITTIGFNFLQQAADVVLDDNKDNKAQMTALWNQEKKTILVGAIDATKAIVIEEVNDPKAETYIVSLLDEVREAIAA